MLTSLSQIKSHVSLAHPRRHTSHLFQNRLLPLKWIQFVVIGGTKRVCVCVCACLNGSYLGTRQLFSTQSTKDIFNLGKMIDHYIHSSKHPDTNVSTHRCDSPINETIKSFTIICCVSCCMHGQKHQPTVPAASVAHTATTSPVTMRARHHL